jgi:hypothetical protein
MTTLLEQVGLNKSALVTISCQRLRTKLREANRSAHAPQPKPPRVCGLHQHLIFLRAARTFPSR